MMLHHFQHDLSADMELGLSPTSNGVWRLMKHKLHVSDAPRR